MIDKAQASAKVAEYRLRHRKRGGYDHRVWETYTREEDFGWVFFYNTKEFIETGDRSWALAGNAPLIVDKGTGELHETGTAFPLEHYLTVYRRDGHLRDTEE